MCGRDVALPGDRVRDNGLRVAAAIDQYLDGDAADVLCGRRGLSLEWQVYERGVPHRCEVHIRGVVPPGGGGPSIEENVHEGAVLVLAAKAPGGVCRVRLDESAFGGRPARRACQPLSG